MKNRIYQPDRRIGVWIDKNKVYLIKISSENPALIEQIDSDIIERMDETGEAPYTEQTPFSRQEKRQHHEHNSQLKFFQLIISHLKNEQYAFIFGPGTIKQELINAIEKEGPHFPCKVVGVEAADKLTNNQMIQKVIDFFTSLRFEDAKRRLLAKTD